MRALRNVNNRFRAFYYVSHASFLFAFPNERAGREVLDMLHNAGMPDVTGGQERILYAGGGLRGRH